MQPTATKAEETSRLILGPSLSPSDFPISKKKKFFFLRWLARLALIPIMAMFHWTQNTRCITFQTQRSTCLFKENAKFCGLVQESRVVFCLRHSPASRQCTSFESPLILLDTALLEHSSQITVSLSCTRLKTFPCWRCSRGCRSSGLWGLERGLMLHVVLLLNSIYP